ncbi:hypothetical protein [Azospirillum formosense]|uniref:hypothetical protein n=1 Tax=Azospirillum formosense TaxID=861533 RepID=UPI00338F8D6B
MPGKTLVCIINQTRGHELTWPTFERHVLHELDADLAVCIGIRPGYDETNPFYANARYRWTQAEPDDYADLFDDVAQRIGTTADWRILLPVPGIWLGGIKASNVFPGSSAIGYFYRWMLFQRLRDEGLLERYDRFVITRSDYYYLCPHPPVESLDPRFFWTPDGEDWGGVVDRHAVIGPEDMEAALNFLEVILRDPQGLHDRMRAILEHNCRLHECDWNWNPERCLRMELERLGVAHRLRRFPYGMFLIRGNSDTSTWSMGQFDPSLGGFVKYQGEYEAARNTAQRFRTRRDWEAFLTGAAAF